MTGPVQTNYGPGQVPIQIFREFNGALTIHAFGQTWTPTESDQVARILVNFACIAAASNQQKRS